MCVCVCVCVCACAWVSICCLVPLTGRAAGKMRLVSPLPMGPPVLLPPAGSPLNGGHIASSGCGKYKYKYKCVHFSMHTSETIIMF